MDKEMDSSKVFFNLSGCLSCCEIQNSILFAVLSNPYKQS